MAKEGETLWDRVASQMAGGVVQAETPESPEEVEGPPAGAPSLPGDQLQSQTRQFYDVGIKALQLAAAGGLPQFAQDRVTIRDKSGSLRPFMFNRAQIFAHEMAERQLAERGYVRVIVLKGRQMGLSTYILCRGLFKVTRKTGQKAYILTHEIPATLNLFNIVKGMYDRIDPRLKPQAGRSNKQEMEFPGLSSGYSVGTAKSGETGRSLTVQFFHGSECAFWAAAKQIVPGLMQTIGLVPGTEIWLESTANGPSNYFASAVQAARKGATEFELCFVPWHWDPMYSTAEERVPEGFEDSLDQDDKEYRYAHSLSLGQMHWRRKKTADFAVAEGNNLEAGKIKFAQEYPATVEEAFQTDTANSFIQAMPVVVARKLWREECERTGLPRPEAHGIKRMGIDPSYTGGDGFRIWCRQGRVAWRTDKWEKLRTRASLDRILAAFDKEQPDEVYIDVGNNGGPLFDLLCEDVHWGSRVIPVMFGDAADDNERHQNKRCEMWYRMREWLTDKAGMVMLEDIEEIQADLTGLLTRRDEVGTRTKLESKDDMRKRLGKDASPDDGDALATTFAYASGGPKAGGKSRAPDPRRAVHHGPGM